MLLSASLKETLYFILASGITRVLVETTRFCGPEGAGLKNMDKKFDSLILKWFHSFGTKEHCLAAWEDTNTE